MKERPILFSAPMVRAILDGTKTQTRRVVKHENSPEAGYSWVPCLCREIDPSDTPCVVCSTRFGGCPYGVPGDALWVRETWAGRMDPSTRDEVIYRADGERFVAEPRWRPSIYMPRWASRITLAVESVRAERLRDISEEDARAEGVTPLFGRYVAGFASLWTQINGNTPGADWDDCNPWVWVIGFKRVQP